MGRIFGGGLSVLVGVRDGGSDVVNGDRGLPLAERTWDGVGGPLVAPFVSYFRIFCV